MLHGTALFELQDKRTGAVTRFKEDNMFTNALDEIFNKTPYYFNNRYAADFKILNNTYSPMTPIIGKALGGLLLFPQTIEENANLIYAPASNKPTGIASFNDYTGADSRRGSYDGVASGPITNGFKFVWNFAESRANGLISCACLTSDKGGVGYMDSREDLFYDPWLNNNQTARGMYRDINGATGTVFGSDNTGIYILNRQKTTVFKYDVPRHDYSLLTNVNANVRTLGNVAVGSIAFYDGAVYVARTAGNSSGNATVYLDRYDPNTWEKTTQTLTIPAALRQTTDPGWDEYVITITFGIDDSYYWFFGAKANTVYRISKSNLADIMEITVANDKSQMISFNGGVMGHNFIIEADGTPHGGFEMTANVGGLVGAYALTSPVIPREWLSCGVTVFTPYLATINNLSQPVTKSANQTLRVTYQVTES